MDMLCSSRVRHCKLKGWIHYLQFEKSWQSEKDIDDTIFIFQRNANIEKIWHSLHKTDIIVFSHHCQTSLALSLHANFCDNWIFRPPHRRLVQVRSVDIELKSRRQTGCGTYLIFVIFSTPPYFLGLQKVRLKNA